MELDNSMKYQSKRIEIEKIVKRIQELGITTSKIEKIIHKIEADLNKKLDDITIDDNAKEVGNISLNEYLYNDCYCKAINHLDKLKIYLLKEYETYSNIQGRTLSIESYLENITKTTLPQIINLILKNLKEIKASSTIDYRDEKLLVEKIYEQAYQIIKTELIYKEESIILNKVLNSDIDINFIEKLLIEEIDKLDPVLPENKEIINRIKILRESGLESTYLDLELLNLLKYVNNPELLISKKEYIINSYQTLLGLQENIQSLLTDQELETERYQRYDKNDYKFKKEIFKYSSYFAISLSILSGTIFGITTLAKKVSTYKTYHTTIETYDASKKELNQEEKYTDLKENYIYLKQYFPYDEIQTKYQRKVLTYDVSDLDYENLKDYSLIDLNTLNFAPEIITETVYSLNPSDYYQEPRTIIEKVTVDKNLMKQKINKSNYIWLSVLFNLFPVIFELIVIISAGFYSDKGKYSSWYSEIKNNFKELKDNKFDLEEAKQELLEINKDLNEVYQNGEQLLKELSQEYNRLPSFIKEQAQFIKIKKKIKEIEEKK